jgi:hypothetical protein
MEKTEIDQRIKSLIFYSDSVERSDAPLELKREKLENIEREKLYLESIIDDMKFKEFMREFIIGMALFIAAISILLFCFVFYGS